MAVLDPPGGVLAVVAAVALAKVGSCRVVALSLTVAAEVDGGGSSGVYDIIP